RLDREETPFFSEISHDCRSTLGSFCWGPTAFGSHGFIHRSSPVDQPQTDAASQVQGSQVARIEEPAPSPATSALEEHHPTAFGSVTYDQAGSDGDASFAQRVAAGLTLGRFVGGKDAKTYIQRQEATPGPPEHIGLPVSGIDAV